MVVNKTMFYAATVYIKPDDLSLTIDAVGKCASGPGKVDNCVDAVAVEEALFGTGVTIQKVPCDLSLGIDGRDSSVEAPWGSYGRVGAIGIEKT
jgi:hypothetical protein